MIDSPGHERLAEEKTVTSGSETSIQNWGGAWRSCFGWLSVTALDKVALKTPGLHLFVCDTPPTPCDSLNEVIAFVDWWFSVSLLNSIELNPTQLDLIQPDSLSRLPRELHSSWTKRTRHHPVFASEPLYYLVVVEHPISTSTLLWPCHWHVGWPLLLEIRRTGKWADAQPCKCTLWD